MPKFIIKEEKGIHIKIQEVEPKITSGGHTGYRSGKSKSIRIYGNVSVEEIFEIVKKALEKASEE